MKKLRHLVGTAICMVSEILFILAFACFVAGQWFIRETNSEHTQ
mgnify:CR=1 FL=1